MSPSYPSELFARVTLPPPPKNSSREVARELAFLKQVETTRTAKDIADIYAEINPDTVYFAGHTIAEYLDATFFPKTAALLGDSFNDVTIVVLQQKRLFDRVRPSALEPELEPAVPVPGHPAYPSGHSAQMHYIAYVLGELAPERKAEFIARAEQIAHNREIAGLHYPSDTAAGVLLAQQFFAIMMRNEKFTTLLAAAKKEWATHPALLPAQANP